MSSMSEVVIDEDRKIVIGETMTIRIPPIIDIVACDIMGTIGTSDPVKCGQMIWNFREDFAHFARITKMGMPELGLRYIPQLINQSAKTSRKRFCNSHVILDSTTITSYCFGNSDRTSHEADKFVSDDISGEISAKSFAKYPVVVMGNTTWKSIGRSHFPGRHVCVLSRSIDCPEMTIMPSGETVFYVKNVREAVIKSTIMLDPPVIYVAGGGQIYAEFAGDVEFSPDFTFFTLISSDFSGIVGDDHVVKYVCASEITSAIMMKLGKEPEKIVRNPCVDRNSGETHNLIFVCYDRYEKRVWDVIYGCGHNGLQFRSAL